MSERPLVFISYTGEAEELAKILAKEIDRVFRDAFDFFVAAKPGTIPPGDPFLNDIEQRLAESSAYIILCSKMSIQQAWVNFETGAARLSRILHQRKDKDTAPNVFLLTYAGLKPHTVTQGPFAGMEFLDIADKDAIYFMMEKLGEVIDTKVPDIFEPEKLIAALPEVAKGPEFHEFILPALRKFSTQAKGKIPGVQIRNVVHVFVKGASLAKDGVERPRYIGLEPTFDISKMYECDLCGESAEITDTGCCDTCGLFCSIWFKPTESK